MLALGVEAKTDDRRATTSIIFIDTNRDAGFHGDIL